VRWADDGFPVIGNDGTLDLEQESPLELEAAAPAEPERDDFDADVLAPHWNYLRNPDPTHYSTSERPGWLRLRGSAVGLDDVASPTWVGRRQGHFRVHVAARLEFQPTSGREEAGLSIRMNEHHHYEVFLTLRAGRRCVAVRRRIGTLQAEVACRLLPSTGSSWVLSMDADRDTYRFSFGPSATELERLADGETRYLSTEVAGGFTGVYFAIYATGNGEPCAGPADFDWFDHRVTAD
jgi:alpha-N-arabinofuranosidase